MVTKRHSQRLFYSMPYFSFGSVLASPPTDYTIPPLENPNLETRWVEVLVDYPGQQELYTYSLAPGLVVQPGSILSVPFGSQQLGAIAIQLLSAPPENVDPQKIKQVEEVISHNYFPDHYWQLLSQVAAYYKTSLVAVINAALPPGMLSKSQRRIKIRPDIPPQGEVFLNSSAKEILRLLREQKEGEYSWQYLQQQIKFAPRGLRELLKLGWVESYLESPKPPRPKLAKTVTSTQASEYDRGDEQLKVTIKQKEVLDILRRRGGELGLKELLQISMVGSSVVTALATKGLVVIQLREVLRTGGIGVRNPDQPKVLNPDQASALERISQISGFAQVLLHGVTGSGKTEVYLQAIAPILAQGKSALVLVPEIGLTPQLTDRFCDRFGSKVFVYHSALSAGERYDTWRQMMTGEPQVVIGTRSAVFAPLPNLGIIILDEEHDTSFKQDQPAPAYHARRVAQWRSQLADCPLILGSATPDLETWLQCADSQKSPSLDSTPYTYLPLPARINNCPPPQIEIIDMRQEFQEGNKSIFSRKLREAIASMQSQRQQGILFVPRRGYSTFVSCRSCGYVMECPHCDVSLSYHHTKTGENQLLQCHYCNYTRHQPKQCPECSSPYFKFFGSGTQRVTQELADLFPSLRLLRFDSDTTRTKDAHRHLLERFAQGEADLLIGTQMLTKGIDLAQITLVGVVAADGLLHMADYRATESTYQTLLQVAGRAGRGAEPGRVLIQTYSPQHPIIAAVQQQNYESFATAALGERVDLGYPPYGKLVLLRFSGLNGVAVQTAAERVADYLEDLPEGNFDLLGPAPATILRVADRFRWQILLKYPPQGFLVFPPISELRRLCPQGISLAIDVDPLNLS